MLGRKVRALAARCEVTSLYGAWQGWRCALKLERWRATRRSSAALKALTAQGGRRRGERARAQVAARRFKRVVLTVAMRRLKSWALAAGMRQIAVEYHEASKLAAALRHWIRLRSLVTGQRALQASFAVWGCRVSGAVKGALVSWAFANVDCKDRPAWSAWVRFTQRRKAREAWMTRADAHRQAVRRALLGESSVRPSVRSRTMILTDAPLFASLPFMRAQGAGAHGPGAGGGPEGVLHDRWRWRSAFTGAGSSSGSGGCLWLPEQDASGP